MEGVNLPHDLDGRHPGRARAALRLHADARGAVSARGVCLRAKPLRAVGASERRASGNAAGKDERVARFWLQLAVPEGYCAAPRRLPCVVDAAAYLGVFVGSQRRWWRRW